MGPLSRHYWFERRWFVAAAGVTLAFAGVCLTAHKSAALTAFADIFGLVLMLVATGIVLANAISRPQHRSFWLQMALGFCLWDANQLAWTIREAILRRPIPDPFFFDIILFFHTAPMIAAVAWRPDLKKKEGKIALSLLSFLMLMGWWVFLYAFIVFPHQYVVPNTGTYNLYYDRLYGTENAVLLAVLGMAAWTSSGGWRKFYLHVLAANVVYGINSQLLDRASANDTYYSGSVYDIALIGTVAWMAAAAWSARGWELKPLDFNLSRTWKKLVPQLAMLAILSLPALGFWTAMFDHSPAPSRVFRVSSVLTAMLVLGAFVFLRQYLQDQELISLLHDSRRAYESQKQLQTQLVQKEKLASLGNLIAGAAHEIDYPLSSIMNYSEQLWSKEGLSQDQNTLVRKIVNQARRTRDLVSNLLSFAQQAPGEKTLVEVGVLLSRAIQMLESRRPPGKIQVQLSIDPDFPRVRANANQLFQAFIEMIENAMDALEGRGGILEISARREGEDVVLQFSDNGPGIRDPQRVFDPFYTTKPVGKGTGLGLSAVYGVVQDHGGQISCQNKPQGGALFVVRLPVGPEPAAQVATAAH
jgi:signal transduction histidine kinase